MSKPFHFDLSADDPARAADFYRKVFSWQVEKWAGPSDYWLIKTGDDKDPGITGGVASRIAPGDTTVMMIDVSDVEDFAERIKKAGGTIREPKRAIPGVGYLVTCRDTDGNSFGIMQIDPNAKCPRRQAKAQRNGSQARRPLGQRSRNTERRKMV